MADDAQREGPLGPPAPIEIQDDDDEQKQFDEVEVLLNEILLVDESGRIVLRKEFRNSLPFPAERVEGMLGSFVELGDDGKMRIKDRDAVRPYLPMIRGFLGGGLERLKELQKLPPEERREAMQRLFGQARGLVPGVPDQKPEPRVEPKPAPRVEPRPEPRPEPRVEEPKPMPERNPWYSRRDTPRAEPQGDGRRRRARGEDDAPGGGSVEERLTRMERQLGRIERMLRQGGPSARRPRARRGNPMELLRRLFEERGERGGRGMPDMRELFERGGRGMPDLRELFERGGRDRDRDEGRGDERPNVFERGRRWQQGMRKLFEIMEPEDLDRLRKGLGAMTKGGFDPSALRDPSSMMEKMQGELSPEDTLRFMEMFSEFVGTPEGRAFSGEVEHMVKRLEKLVNSEQGERMGQLLERLQRGERSGVQEQLENLIQPRRGGRNAEGHTEGERRSARKRHGNPPAGSKLY